MASLSIGVLVDGAGIVKVDVMEGKGRWCVFPEHWAGYVQESGTDLDNHYAPGNTQL